MPIVLARIDNRFVHGQILEAWLPYTKATSIIVASDEAANNLVQRMAMEASVPFGFNIQILEVRDAARRLMRREFEKWRVILIFGTSGDALRAVKLGIGIEEVNVGNIHFCPGKLQISPSVSVDKEDLDNFKALTDMGIRVVVRCVPSDPPRNIWEVVKRE
jgi:PTS system mannose-specific IIB component